MGLFKKLKKGVKNIVRGAGKLFKKVFKEVKRFVASDLGKFVMVAAIAWGGYALLSAAQAGGAGTALAGAGSTTGAAAGTAAGTGATTAATAAQVAAAEAAGVSATTGAVAGSANLAPMTIGQQAISAGHQAVNALGTAGTAVKDAASTASTWMEANPTATKIGGSMIGAVGEGMVSRAEQDRLEKEEKRRKGRENIAGVNYSGSGTALRYPTISDARKAQVAQLKSSTV